MDQFLLGAISMANLTVMSFFIKFWYQTKDHFFLFFAVTFLLLSVERFLAVIETINQEISIIIYLIRLAAYAFIIIGIISKNIHRQRG